MGGIQYTVMYARFGDVQNPQFGVVSAKAEQITGSLQFRGAGSEEAAPETFHFHASVSFIEMPDNRMQKLFTPPRPPLPIKLPRDFFAPFFESASAVPFIALALLSL